MSSELEDPFVDQYQQQNPSINQQQRQNAHQQNHHNADQQYYITEQPQEQPNRVLISSEFRQSGNQPEDEPYESNTHDISQIKNIDQWVRIVPCVILGLVSIIINSIFYSNCNISQVSIYTTSGAVLIVLPLVVYFYDINSKFMNFVASLISFYLMIVLAIYANQQRYQNLDDESFYNQYCLKEGDNEPHKNISYGIICLLGLTMCLLHTLNAVYYFAEIWIHSSHQVKQKIENYTIELL